MVIIRINANLCQEDFNKTAQSILIQAATTGVVVLPNYCELLNEVPADEEIKVIQQDPRVAELEAKVAAMQKSDCDTCGTKTCNARSASVVRINCPLWQHSTQKANKTAHNMPTKKKAIYQSFNSHDCEAFYRCPD